VSRTDRFSELFALGDVDPSRIAPLMRFGGFDDFDVYLVETASGASPDDFAAAISDPDADRASQATVRLLSRMPSGAGLAGLIQDMRRASGLSALKVADEASDTRQVIRPLVAGGRVPDKGSMVRMGIPAGYASMVEYVHTFCLRELRALASETDGAVVSAMIDRICEDTGLDRRAVAGMAEDVAPEKRPEPPESVDKGLSFKKYRVSEAFVKRYSGASSDVTVPRTVDIGGRTCEVVGIGSGAFNGNGSIRRVSIPDSVREIGRYAFFRCGSLERVDLPAGLKAIGEGAFCKCGRLSPPSFPRGLETIGQQAFLGCESFDRVLVPKEAVLGPHAFPDGTAVVRRRSDVASPDLQGLLGAAGRYLGGGRVLEVLQHILDHPYVLGVRGFAEHQEPDLAPVVEGPQGVHGLVGLLSRLAASGSSGGACGGTALEHVLLDVGGHLGEGLPA
jgi:hypothetical protein